ncbi:hypothetical protein M3Y97_00920300 [Aphelenchoides bicaudatus]|nr:hypothetical protein M3Y97_00920300 [Aphelenchoides bicaudatus]
MRCRDLQQNPNIGLQPLQSQLTMQYGRTHCPDNPAAIVEECGDSVPCLHDYVTFNSKIMGLELQNSWNVFEVERSDTLHNSCGPINIEYPEYLTKIPAFASGYLQGDVVRFDCFQTHWIKGDYEYKCGIVVDYNNPSQWRFEWNKGSQPWCRSREMENYLKYMAAFFGTIAVIMVIMLIYFTCWSIGKRRRDQAAEVHAVEYKTPPFQRRYDNEAYIPEGEKAEPVVFGPSSRDASPTLRFRGISDPNAQSPQYQTGLLGLNTSV